MILSMWTILVFTCFIEKSQVSPNLIERRGAFERISSPNELFSIDSPISNPISLNSRRKRSAAFPTQPEGLDENTVNITSEIVALGLQLANVTLQQIKSLEKMLQCMGIVIPEGATPEFVCLQYLKTTAQSLNIAEIGYIQEYVSKAIIETLQLTADQVRASLHKVQIPPIAGCPPPPFCIENDALYRSHDGGCNNLINPHWGKSFTPYMRKTQNTYADGLSTPRKSVVNGEPLRSARTISATIAVDVDYPSSEFSLSVMQWGQFIEHDLTQSTIKKYNDLTSGILCCDSSGPLNASESHPECFPIDIPEDDPYYSPFGRRCMNFVRALPGPNANCDSLGSRKQLNQVTHYLDGSTVYGSTDEEANKLRQFTGGLLTVRPGNFLPDDDSTTAFDFLAGDSRVNGYPHLSVIHTIWVREHNRVATKLSQLNSTWNDETIYQKARKIVVAEIQHIVYKEWLPCILGTTKMNEYGLLPLTSGFVTEYDEKRNPSILSEFFNVAIKFVSTLMPENVTLYDVNNMITESLKISDIKKNPENLVTPPAKFDEFVRSLYLQPMQDFDNFIIDDLTNELYKTTQDGYGLDLVALTIQRGRDYGIGTYNDIRHSCRLCVAHTFEALKSYMEPSVVEAFANLYSSVEDLDGFIAGLSEMPVPGGIVGETLNCIFAHQFYNLKYGDRFYYENGGLPSSFMADQLTEIRKASWARIICDNDQNIKDIPRSAFRLPDSFLNPKIQCTNAVAIPKVDLNKFSK